MRNCWFSLYSGMLLWDWCAYAAAWSLGIKIGFLFYDSYHLDFLPWRIQTPSSFLFFLEFSSFSEHLQHFARFVGSLYIINEACSEDFDPAGGHFFLLDWPVAGIYNSTKQYLVAANLFSCVAWMLWFVNGWSWLDAVSNLSSRFIASAAGYCWGQGLFEAERCWRWFRLMNEV